MHDSSNYRQLSFVVEPAHPSLAGLDLLLLRFIILAPFPIIPVRIRHLLVTPAAVVRRVVLLRHIGLGTGLKILVETLVVFVGGTSVHAGGDDFFLRGVDVGVVEGGLDKGGRLESVISMEESMCWCGMRDLHHPASRCGS